ncbi:MAG: M1 family aminopeptidase [Bryobacteraceae bacterium]
MTEVIAHELAHQWFGNMVTPLWWDDIWLNEAFASWIELKVLDTLFPEWNTKIALVSEKDRAMTKDSLLSARKVRQAIVTPGDIGNAFDSITYRKGGAIIRMFESWLGPRTFQRGVQAYIAKHAWGNATADDFLNAISASAKRDVNGAFSALLDRGGLPLLRVSLKCDGGKARVAVTQERFLPLGSQGDRKVYWQIPVCVKYDKGRQCTLLADREAEIVLEKANGCPDWIYASEDSSNYYVSDTRVIFKKACRQCRPTCPERESGID